MLITDSTSFDLFSIVVIMSRLSMSSPLFRKDQHSIHSRNEGPRRAVGEVPCAGECQKTIEQDRRITLTVAESLHQLDMIHQQDRGYSRSNQIWLCCRSIVMIDSQSLEEPR
jgi:hypothetical protein